MLLTENVENVFPLGVSCIVEPISFYSITAVDQQKVRAFGVGFVTQVFCKTDIVTPVGAIRGPRILNSANGILLGILRSHPLIQMAGQPAMSVCSVEKVQLTPGQVSQWRGYRRRRGWLNR